MKDYYVEAWLNNRWVLLHTYKRHGEALEYVADHAGERYPFRVVRVERTIVFGEGAERRKRNAKK